MKMFSFPIALFGCLLFVALPVHAAPADHVVVGVNVTNNDGTLSQAFQEEEIRHLAENDVKTIRVGLVAAAHRGVDTPNDYAEFVRAYRAGEARRVA